MSLTFSQDVEGTLLNLLLPESGQAAARAIFILGAPRTGSTLLYQAVSSRFGLPYVSNLTNDRFAETPIVGFAIQKALPPAEITYTSRYGTTQGALQPSEGSAVMRRWFGGGHPSAVVSTTLRAGMKEHFLATLRAANSLFGRPLVIKNAWNCFRIRCLAETLPHARFIWIRRDVAAAAKSDLAARHVRHGTSTTWNSATPANLKELQRLPPHAQVVENQYAFNTTLDRDLRSFAQGRWARVLYEEFCRDPEGILTHLGRSLDLPAPCDPTQVKLDAPGNWVLSQSEQEAIDSYIAARPHLGKG